MGYYQLVYTSPKESVGRGYVTVGASRELEPVERAVIETWLEPLTVIHEYIHFKGGLDFFHIDEKAPRECVVRVFGAGEDHVGRPNRFVAHALVFERDDFREKLGNDPFLVQELGMLKQDENVPRGMPSPGIPVGKPAGPRRATVDVLVRGLRSSTEQLCRILGAILSGRKVVVIASEAPVNTLRLAFRCVPQGLRRKLTFSTFALSGKKPEPWIVFLPPQMDTDEHTGEPERLKLNLEPGHESDAPEPTRFVQYLVPQLLSGNADRFLSELHEKAARLGLDQDFEGLDELADLANPKAGPATRIGPKERIVKLTSALQRGNEEYRTATFRKGLAELPEVVQTGGEVVKEFLEAILALQKRISLPATDLIDTLADSVWRLCVDARYDKAIDLLDAVDATDAAIGGRLAAQLAYKHGEAFHNAAVSGGKLEKPVLRLLRTFMASGVAGGADLVRRASRLADLANLAREQPSQGGGSSSAKETLLRLAVKYQEDASSTLLPTEERKEVLGSLRVTFQTLGDRSGVVTTLAPQAVEQGSGDQGLQVWDQGCQLFIGWLRQDSDPAQAVSEFAASLREQWNEKQTLHVLKRCLDLGTDAGTDAWRKMFDSFEKLALSLGRDDSREAWASAMGLLPAAPDDVRQRILKAYLDTLSARQCLAVPGVRLKILVAILIGEVLVLVAHALVRMLAS